jgi:hypothetical protein
MNFESVTSGDYDMGQAVRRLFVVGPRTSKGEVIDIAAVLCHDNAMKNKAAVALGKRALRKLGRQHYRAITALGRAARMSDRLCVKGCGRRVAKDNKSGVCRQCQRHPRTARLARSAFPPAAAARQDAINGAERERSELRWLAANRHRYAGRWVALDGYNLLAVGDSAEAVYRAIANVEATPLVTRVEPEDEVYFAGW